MRSDRRTLVFLGIVVVFFVASVSFRSYLLYGARVLTNQVSIFGDYVFSAPNKEDSANLGLWSTQLPAIQPQASRDALVGQTLMHMAKDWNLAVHERREALAPMEEYCKQHPEDIPAKAHLLRLALNINSLKGTRDLKMLTEQSARLAAVARDCATKEPDNWYWREREVHFLVLLGRNDEAIEQFTAKPLPRKFVDYVEDEVKCKVAYMELSYLNLPASNRINLWAATIYPHFSFGAFKDLVEIPSSELKFRTATIEFGRAMLRSSQTGISTLVGVRNIRLGLWKKPYEVSRQEKSKTVIKAEEARLKATYVGMMSASDWDKVRVLAAENIQLPFFDVEEDLRVLYIAQFGPILISTGIFSSLVGFAGMLILRRKKFLVSNAFLGWCCLAGGLLLATGLIDQYKYFANYSLKSSVFYLPIAALTLWAIIATFRSDSIKPKYGYCGLLLVSVAIGFINSNCQVGAILFLIAFVVQKGKLPLGPWMTATLSLILMYHLVLNLAFAQINWGGIFALLIGSLSIFWMSKTELEPDQPRLPSLTIGLAACILGVFLMAYYDRSVVTFMDSELQRTQQLQKKYEGV